MEDSIIGRKTTRRAFLKTVGLTGLVALAAPVLAACGQQAAPSPTAAPAAAPTKAPEAAPTKAPEAAPTATPAPAEPTATAAPVAPTPTPATQATGKIKEVPRNRTLIMPSTGTQLTNWDQWNLYPPSANHQDGGMILYEPLAFYSAFADKEVLWLAESYAYNKDYTELTIKTRKGVTWSDGVPFTSADVAYTFNTLKELGPAVKFGVEVQQVLDNASTPDENTVVCKFKVPAARFFFQATYKYDLGLYIVPKHIYEKQDWLTYKANDIEKGEPVTTSPWKLVQISPQQKIYDLRDEDYWAVKAGVVPRKPLVQRQIQTIVGASMQTAEQAIIANEVDYMFPHIPQDVKAMIEANPAITSHTGRGPNYGYIDWWPLSLYVNCSVPPFDKKEVRWAVSRYLDREKIVQVAYNGYTSLWPWNFPSYPGLRPYIEKNKDLFEGEYNTLEYNPAKADKALTDLGWKKDADGIWIDETGKRQEYDVPGYEWMGIVGPTVCEMLTQAGFKFTWSMPPDAMDRFTKGDYVVHIYGHGGSIKDPYDTMRLYQSATLAVPGWHMSNFTKWVNTDYDAVVDEMYLTGMDETDKLHQLFRKAMEIWLPELPDIPLVEFYHNGGLNETYWKNWPLGAPGDKTGVLPAPTNYCNEASWHLTWGYVMQHLEPSQA